MNMENRKKTRDQISQKQTIENLGWEFSPHPAYSPDLDYHLFRSMQHFLSQKTFQKIESARKEVAQYFASTPVIIFFAR